MIALLFAASLLPLAISGFIHVRQSREQLLANDKALLRSGSEQIARELDEYIRGRLQSARRIATFPETTSFCRADSRGRSAMLASVNGLLATFPASDPAIFGAALLDREGRVLASANPTSIGTDASYRPFVKTALQGHEAISDIFLSTPSSHEAPTLAFAVPMQGPGGEVSCVAALGIHAEALWQRIRASDGLVGPGSFAVLFDGLGIRIGHSYNTDIVFHPGGRLDAPLVDQLVAERRFGPRTRALLEDVRPFPQQFERARAATPNREVFLGFAPVNQTMNYGVARRFETVPWTLFYMLPESNVSAQLTRLTVQQALLALAIMMAALAVGLMFARAIVRPILRLGAAASAIATGDLTVRVPVDGRDEVGTLSCSFNRMAEQIQEQSEALHHSRDELEHRVEERTRELASAAEQLRGEIRQREAAEGRLQAQLERLNLLDQVTCAIGERQDLQSIYQVAIRALEDRLPVDFSCICNYDAPGNRLIVTRVGMLSAPVAMALAMPESAVVPIDENGLSQCVRGHLVYEADLELVDFPFPRRLLQGGLRALVMAPLHAESRAFGILVAARKAPDSFSSGECEFLRQLSAHVALAARQAELHATLQGAYDDLRQSQQSALQQERLRALGEMASGIAHDINNAISPAVLYTESLIEREDGLSPRGLEKLRTIAMAIDDVAATVGRMREFYRPREPQEDLRPVPLNDLLRHVVELTRAKWHDMAQQRGVVVTVALDLAPDPPWVPGIETALREALINLVFNAIDAMPAGGTLTLRARRNPGDGHVHVEVADTGIGMDETTRSRCLEPFFTTKGERGTGLGLAMVYGVAQRHGAEIEIESTPEVGTVVRLVFAGGHDPGSSATSGMTRSAPVERLRILVVDDDPVILMTLTETLQRDGHAVVSAPGGQAGVDAVRSAVAAEQTFDLVITDLGMPYVDGRRLAQAVKELAPDLPVIMLTGWGQRLVAEGDVPLSVDLVMAKPPKLAALRAGIAEVLQSARRRDSIGEDA